MCGNRCLIVRSGIWTALIYVSEGRFPGELLLHSSSPLSCGSARRTKIWNWPTL